MTPARQVELAAIRLAIRTAGLRCTAPRVAVLDRLRQIAAPITRKGLVAALMPLGFDGTTIYRNLKDLADVSIVVCLDLGDHVRRYEVRARGAAQGHPHFVCTGCGNAWCLSDREVKVEIRARRVHVGQVSEVLIRGKCERCRSARRTRPSARSAPGTVPVGSPGGHPRSGQ
ncbi:transcriptional repressor [Candidatus Binatia bacterium]|nr:transcriptional repressor [Candidatus Binatia bacterium]